MRMLDRKAIAIRRVRAAALTLAFAALCTPSRAFDHAADEANRPAWRYSGGAHAAPRWVTVYSGFTRTATGKLYETVAFIRSTGGGGAYEYEASRIPRYRITGLTSFSDLVFGWQQVNGPLTASLALGINAVTHQLTGFDPKNRVQGSRIGIKAEATLYYVHEQAWVISGHASYAAAYSSWSARAAVARRFGGFDAGLEAAAFGNLGGSTLQLGAVAETSIGRAFFRLSGGLSLKAAGRSGPYAAVNAGYTF